jgi:hypothetical protein
MEINSNDREEYRTESRKHFYYNEMFRNFILKKVKLFIAVTNELGSLFSKYSKNTYCIANGINAFPDIKAYPPKNQKIVVTFVGSPNQIWHGIDKLPFIAESIPECEIHVVGAEIAHPRIISHGYLTTVEVNQLLQRSDVGIGTLSLYEKKLVIR